MSYGKHHHSSPSNPNARHHLSDSTRPDQLASSNGSDIPFNSYIWKTQARKTQDNSHSFASRLCLSCLLCLTCSALCRASFAVHGYIYSLPRVNFTTNASFAFSAACFSRSSLLVTPQADPFFAPYQTQFAPLHRCYFPDLLSINLRNDSLQPAQCRRRLLPGCFRRRRGCLLAYALPWALWFGQNGPVDGPGQAFVPCPHRPWI